MPLNYPKVYFALNLHVGIIALLFAGAFAHFLWERVRFEFDPRRRIIIWKRHKLFTGIEKGQIAFDNVTDVTTQSVKSISHQGTYTRVALVMKERRLSLTRVYGNGTNETVQTIREIVGLGSTTKTF